MYFIITRIRFYSEQNNLKNLITQMFTIQDIISEWKVFSFMKKDVHFFLRQTRKAEIRSRKKIDTLYLSTVTNLYSWICNLLLERIYYQRSRISNWNQKVEMRNFPRHMKFPQSAQVYYSKHKRLEIIQIYLSKLKTIQTQTKLYNHRIYIQPLNHLIPTLAPTFLKFNTFY